MAASGTVQCICCLGDRRPLESDGIRRPPAREKLPHWPAGSLGSVAVERAGQPCLLTAAWCGAGGPSAAPRLVSDRQRLRTAAQSARRV